MSQEAKDDTALPLNIPMATFGGSQVWSDIRVSPKWRLQRNAVTEHFRLLDDNNIRRAWGPLAAVEAEYEKETAATRETDFAGEHVVVFVHGLGRTRRSFNPMAYAVERAGYRAVPLSYASTRQNLDQSTRQICSVLRGFEKAEKISFVTHSLGGIVVRNAFKICDLDGLNLHKLVQLGTPNQGAAIARVLEPLVVDPFLNEDILVDLQADKVNALPNPPIPTLVIAGALKISPNVFLDEANDGVVTVSEAWLPPPAIIKTLPLSHSFMPNSTRATKEVLEFLE